MTSVIPLQTFLNASLTDPVLMGEVARHYWNNPWLPRDVDDWALRLLIPTLTVQVQQYDVGAAPTNDRRTYSAQFERYRAIVGQLAESGFRSVAAWERTRFATLIRGLGMVHVRWQALEGVKRLVARLQPAYLPGDPPAALLASPAAFREHLRDMPLLRGPKVGTLAGIYLWLDNRHGYNRFPMVAVDDGMAVYLAPGLLGRPASPGALSAAMTACASGLDFRALLVELTRASSRLRSDLPADATKSLEQVARYWERELVDPGFTDYWFTHLVLIYQKRLTCAEVARSWRGPCGRCGEVCGALASRRDVHTASRLHGTGAV